MYNWSCSPFVPRSMRPLFRAGQHAHPFSVASRFRFGTWTLPWKMGVCILMSPTWYFCQNIEFTFKNLGIINRSETWYFPIQILSEDIQYKYLLGHQDVPRLLNLVFCSSSVLRSSVSNQELTTIRCRRDEYTCWVNSPYQCKLSVSQWQITMWSKCFR